MVADVSKPIQTVGRRKSAVARVILTPGSGHWHINGREVSDYFPRLVHQKRAQDPIRVVEAEGRFERLW